ncbi:MAG: hypothetical protein AAF645_29285, partial [Myxococcota bacterium]
DACNDGIDNDGDGFRDCSDRSCISIGELRDFDGRMLAVTPCLESVFDPGDLNVEGNTVELLRDVARRRCSDGFDGDSDGFIDCDDWDCQWNPFLNPRAEGIPPADPNNPFSANSGGFCEGFLFNEATGDWEFDSGLPRVTRLRCD